jgi:single-stranded DNA-binding protein
MNLKGTIKTIGIVQHVSDKFKKQEMVLITDESTPYPQTILVEFQQDKCELLANYKEGDKVSVDTNLKGRQWTNNEGVVKTFNTISVWRIESLGEATTPTPTFTSNTNDDLPF